MNNNRRHTIGTILIMVMALIILPPLIPSCDDPMKDKATAATYAISIEPVVVTNHLGGYYFPSNLNISAIELNENNSFIKENIIQDISHGRTKTFTADKRAIKLAIYATYEDRNSHVSTTPIQQGYSTIKVTLTEDNLRELGIGR